ncbi:O-antigen ligase family protein [uncultured Maribacter sp.]|uniref:O-antigen ligase family protein n=1 Tax=uncultured Maribacter sp. TaxID=431308 RepID=UPI0030EFA3E8
MKALIAFLIVLSNMLETNFSLKKILFGSLIMIPLLSLVIASGSRGAFLSVFIGLALFVVFMRISIGKKIVLGLFGIVGSISFFLFVLANNVDFQRRLLDSVETGDIGRNLAWVGAQKVIENNPIIGVGFPAALPEMYQEIGIAMDPHNVFLYVAMTTGLVGFCFFMIFIWRIAKILFLSYKKNGKIVYLVIFFIIVLNMAKAGGGISMILFYFFFAALIGSTFLLSDHEEIEHTVKLKKN